ncbi:SGNH/GDSL hydrolase family protein [Hymenobacter arcticus]
MQWYQEEIRRLAQLPVAGQALPKVVFYGSSTFTHWLTLAPDFPQVQAVNLGFGGSTLAACAWFFEQVVPRQQPAALLVYAGDNDLGDGRTPEEVVLFFEQLLASSKAQLGAIPLCFVSIKPSPARLYLRDNIEYANACIRQRIAALGPPYYFLDLYPAMLDGQGNPQRALYAADGLHLSPAGYALWQQAIGQQLGTMGLLTS